MYATDGPSGVFDLGAAALFSFEFFERKAPFLSKNSSFLGRAKMN
jgi:hypothetical protein